MSFPTSVDLTRKMINTPTAAQKFPLGTRGLASGGRVFYYAKAGAAIDRGWPVKSDTEMTQNVNSTVVKLQSTDTAYTDVTYTSTFQTFRVITSGGVTEAWAKNCFRDGYLYIKTFGSSTDVSGGGQMLRLKSNTALAASDTTGFDVTVAPDENLEETLTTGAAKGGVGIIPSPWYAVKMYAGSATSNVVVGVSPVDVTTLYYFWAQTWGPCAVLSDVITVGEAVNISTTTSTDSAYGGVTDWATGVATDSGTGIKAYMTISAVAWQNKPIGFAMATGAATTFNPVFLQIAP